MSLCWLSANLFNQTFLSTSPKGSKDFFQFKHQFDDLGAVAPDELEDLDNLGASDCDSEGSNDVVYDIEQKIEDEAFRYGFSVFF